MTRTSPFAWAALLVVAAVAQDTRVTPPEGPGKWACCTTADLLPKEDPSRGAVVMPGAARGWDAFHLFTTDTWRLHCVAGARLTDEFGSPQVVVLDEKGRFIILQSDSGKWLPNVVVEDGKASSGWAHGKLDPRIEGPEVYFAGGSGRIYQILLRDRKWTAAPIVAADGVPFSKLVIDDLLPSRPGNEMLALTNAGPLYELVHGDDDGGWALRKIADLGSRARDAVVLPRSAGRPPRVAVVLQSGEVALVTLKNGAIEREALCKEPMSIARIDHRQVDGSEAVYVARVDGLILRFTEREEGGWAREIVYAGPQGPRGLAAGRFDADPTVETIAVFGYSKKVQILSRPRRGAWHVETIYTDPGGGHWLAAVELDGRNVTDELVGGGFSHHVFMVGRKPGYGLGNVPVDPDDGAR